MTKMMSSGRHAQISLLLLLLTLINGCIQIPREQAIVSEPPRSSLQPPPVIVNPVARPSTDSVAVRPNHRQRYTAEQAPMRLTDRQPNHRPTVRLSPQVRITPLNQPISTLPREAIEPFLRHSMVMTQAAWEAAPAIIGTNDGRLLFSTGDRVYAHGNEFDQRPYRVFHRGKEYRDPVNGNSLGFEGIYLGEAILEKEGDPAALRLVATSQDVRSGDRLFPIVDEEGIYQFIPHAPPRTTEGQIIAMLGDDASLIGQYQTVVLNLGEQDGMEPGHVLTILKAGQPIDNFLKKDAKVRLPDEQAGQLMIYKVYDRTSYGLVTNTTQTIRVFDRVASPEA